MTKNISSLPEEARSPLDSRMRASIKAVAVAGAILSTLGGALFGLRSGASVAAGATLAAGNLWALARVVAALLPEPEEGRAAGEQASGSRGAWTFLALIKTAGLLVAAWLILSYRVAAPLPMLVGFGALPIGIAIGALVSDRRPQPKQTP
jgi:hypothetical protein